LKTHAFGGTVVADGSGLTIITPVKIRNGLSGDKLNGIKPAFYNVIIG